jgi:rfaE bifunctional protein nucleotidyltransferase chain/domain
MNPLAKIRTLAEIQKILAPMRAGGSKIVFCNGCFDLIHVGHIRYLQAAKALGGILVVGINSDDSVRGLKGSKRPLQPENERAEILASLDCVDYVVVFDGPTVAPLLLALRPDVHAKGTDYTVEDVPERDTVLSYGGCMAIVGDPKDHSSRNLIEAIRIRMRPS